MNMLHVLVVDDDEEIRNLLSDFLLQNHFTVATAKDTKHADLALSEQVPNLVLLDLNMPGEDGISFCRRFRQNYDVPVIMLTAISEEQQQLDAHNVGVDDYLTKPYNMRVMLAKIKSVLRRYNISETINAQQAISEEKYLVYEFSAWKLNTYDRSLVSSDEILLTLSSNEYNLLVCFLEKPNRILDREQLLDAINGNSQMTGIYDRNVDVLISRFRSKFGKQKESLIKTIRGGGYMFLPKVSKKHVSL